MTLNDAGRVWLRASGANTRLLRPGDRHLWMLLRVHQMVLAGGALRAAQDCTERELLTAIDAAEYFELPVLAKVIHGISVLAVAADEELESLAGSLTEEYSEAVPAGAILVTAFQKKFRNAPEDFAPT